MKTNKLAKTAYLYAMLGLAGGVFYREFPKLFPSFTAVTTLRLVHLHLLALGMLFFLTNLLLEKQFNLSSHKNFGKFYCIYNAGLAVTVTMFLVKGVLQVIGTTFTNGLTGALAGIAGIGHVLLLVGFLFFFNILVSKTKESK